MTTDEIIFAAVAAFAVVILVETINMARWIIDQRRLTKMRDDTNLAHMADDAKS